MWENDNTKKKNLLLIIGVIFVICLIHILIIPDYGDDIKFAKIMKNYDYNIFQVLYHRYFTWSSRIIIEFFDFVIPCFPIYVWKILDILFYIILWKILIDNFENKLLCSLCLLAYPFFHMGSAGWRVTTIVYLWSFVIWLLTICAIKAKKKGYLLIALGTAISTNMEILAVINILLLSVWLFYLYKSNIKEYERPTVKKIAISIMITLINILNALLCPGNEIRKMKGIAKNFPDFYETSFFEKLRICISSTMEHFTSIPDIIFIVLSVLAGILCWQKLGGVQKVHRINSGRYCDWNYSIFFCHKNYKRTYHQLSSTGYKC